MLQFAKSVHTEKTDQPANRLFNLIRKSAEIFDVQMHNENMILSQDHELSKQLNEILESARPYLTVADNSKVIVFSRYPMEPIHNCDSYNITAYLPEALINPATGNIYLSKPFLEAMEYDRSLIAAVIFHELAHKMYEELANENKSAMQRVHAALFDPLAKQLKAYEEEYHCDRVAAMLSSFLGIETNAIAQALTKLVAYDKKIIDESNLKVRTDLEIALISSHPNTPRRTRAVNRLAKHIISHIDRAQANEKLPLVNSQDFSINRPHGSALIRAENSHNFLLSGACSDPYIPDQLYVNFDLTILDYQKILCKNDRYDVDITGFEMPIALPDILEDPYKNNSIYISDWFAIVGDYIDSNCKISDIISFVSEEIQSLNKNQLIQILNNYNSFRIINNDTDIDGCKEHSTRLYSVLPVHIVLSRIVSLIKKEGGDLSDLLFELADINKTQLENFGVSFFDNNPFTLAIADKVWEEANSNIKLKLVQLYYNYDSFFFTLFGRETRRKLVDFAKSHNIHLETFQIHEVDAEKELIKFSQQSVINTTYSRIIINNITDGTFSVSTQDSKNTAYPDLIVTIVAGSLSTEELRQVHDIYNQTIKIRHGLDDTALNAMLKNDRYHKSLFNNSNSGKASKLAELVNIHFAEAIPTIDEQKDFFINRLPDCLQVYLNSNSTHTAIYTTTSSSNTIYDFALPAQLADWITIQGEDGARKEFIGERRDRFDTTSYTKIESQQTTYLAVNKLWTELFSQEYESLPLEDKLDFLISRIRFNSCHKDQLLVQAIGYPELNFMDDTPKVVEKIQQEPDISLLVKLRDNFLNSVLVGVCEDRLYELSLTDNFFNNSLINSCWKGLRGEIDEEILDFAKKDYKLKRILTCHTSASRKRDDLLRTYIEQANSRKVKELFSSLLVDPVLSVSSNPANKKLAYIDTAIDIVSKLHPFEKAETLLYFLGQTRFNSRLLQFFLSHDNVDQISDYSKISLDPQNKYIDAVYNLSPIEREELSIAVHYELRSFHRALPDTIVRLQKQFGLSVGSFLTIQDSFANEKIREDLLFAVLLGENGITSDPKVSKEFFRLAALALVKKSPQLSILDKEQKKELVEFIAYAFQSCPEIRLVNLILSVWEATRADVSSTPELLALVLQKLGPAFIKFGQKLATCNIPTEYKKALRKLSSENNQNDSSYLHHNLDVLFGDDLPFDPDNSGRKLGEGSMAATFLAHTNKDKQACAVKMIHPFINNELEDDIKYIDLLASYINQNKDLFPSLTIPENMPQIVKKQLLQQINTKREIDSAVSFAKVLKSEQGICTFRMVKPIESLSPNGLVVTEYLPGYELDDPEIDRQGINSQTIRNLVGLEILRQILTCSCYQSDVNLGNFAVIKDDNGEILTRPKAEVVWYDAGAIQEIEAEDQKIILNLIKAIFKNDHTNVATFLSKLVVSNDDERALELTKSWLSNFTAEGNPFEKAQDYLNSYLDLLAAEGLLIDEKWLTIANTISMTAPLLEGVSQIAVTKVIEYALTHHKLLTTGELLLLKIKQLL